MRRSSKGDGRGEGSADTRLAHRSGMLRQSELGSADHACEDAEAVNIQFLIAFVRHMLRTNPSSDLCVLSMMAAEREVFISDEQRVAFMRAVCGEMAKSNWPEGFFG